MRNVTYKPNYSTFRVELKKPLMPVRQQLEALKKQVLLFPEGRIMFDAPLVITTKTQMELFCCYGAWADQLRGLWLMDGQGQWHEVHHDDANAEDVIANVIQQVKSLSHERSKVLPEC